MAKTATIREVEWTKESEIMIRCVANGFVIRHPGWNIWLYIENMEKLQEYIRQNLQDHTKYICCKRDSAFFGCDLN